MFNQPYMTEQDDNAELERLCGSIDRAFRLSYLWREVQQDCSGWQFRMGAKDNTLPTFKTRAKSQGYGEKTIALFLKIQGRGI